MQARKCLPRAVVTHLEKTTRDEGDKNAIIEVEKAMDALMHKLQWANIEHMPSIKTKSSIAVSEVKDYYQHCFS